MQYSTIFLSVLAASGVMAAPSSHGGSSGKRDITVSFTSSDDSTTNIFKESDLPEKQRLDDRGPWTQVELRLGEKVKKQDLRCKIYDKNGDAIIVTRGENVDETFADGGNGPWTIPGRKGQKVSKVKCNPRFKQAQPGEFEVPEDDNEEQEGDIVVFLSGSSPVEVGSQTTLTSGKRDEKRPVGSSGPFQTVELRLGENVNPEYRCKIEDQNGRAIRVFRGDNEGFTFGDGDKGAWNFDGEDGTKSKKVSNIICSPKFKKGD